MVRRLQRQRERQRHRCRCSIHSCDNSIVLRFTRNGRVIRRECVISLFLSLSLFPSFSFFLSLSFSLSLSPSFLVLFTASPSPSSSESRFRGLDCVPPKVRLLSSPLLSRATLLVENLFSLSPPLPSPSRGNKMKQFLRDCSPRRFLHRSFFRNGKIFFSPSLFLDASSSLA